MVENKPTGSENITKNKINRYLDNNNLAIEQAIIFIVNYRRHERSIRLLNEMNKDKSRDNKPS